MNRLNPRFPRNLFGSLAIALVLAISFAIVTPAQAQIPLAKVSTDPFNPTGDPESQHHTEVEPDTFAYGSTIVSAFQVARIYGGGGSDIGFATSKDGGKTWTHGLLPGLTKHYKDGSYDAASDASVVYDPKHGEWLISTLPIIGDDGTLDVAVSRSSDGIHWGNPIIVDKSGVDDKNWITCDTTPSSPHYGNCYQEWDQGYSTGLLQMSTSTDGGKTWGPAMATADQATGIGGQPLVQPNGTVVVPFNSFFGPIEAFQSTNGGGSWSSTVQIASQNFRSQDGGLRDLGLNAATVDSKGKIFVLWPDCSFRSGCSSNDIVVSTSTDGVTWSAISRIPIDPINSTVDHFLPGIGIDPATSGKTEHLALTYYYYPVASCDNSCELNVGYTISTNGGKTWTAGKHLAGPMQLSWLPQSQDGLMVTDYLAVSYSKGKPFGVFVVAKAPGSLLNEAMYTTKSPLLTSANEPVFSSQGEKPLPNVRGNYVWKYYDEEGENPIPPSKQRQPPNQK
jgi:hypothetical protein